MSRYITDAERLMLAAGTGYLLRARIRVKNFDGTWIDLGALAVTDRTLRMFNTATLSDDIDKNTLTMSATVKREAGVYSLSPLRSDSPLNVLDDGSTYSPLLDLHREWAIDAVFAPRDTPPTLPDDYREMASGIIDRIDIAGDPAIITIQGRGPEADLIDHVIAFVDPSATPLVAISAETPRTFAGGTVGDVIQAILDAEHGVGVIPLTLDPTAPTEYINGWDQTESIGEMDLLTQIAALGAGNLRYRYAADDTLTLTLFTPPRGVVEDDADYEIGGLEYETLNAGLGLDTVRNFAIVKYQTTTGALETVTSPATPDSASIERYGLRIIGIDLSADTKVNDSGAAQPLADAVVSDWELPFLEQAPTGYGLWFASLHDYVRTLANGVHYDEDQYGAVVGYTQTFANGKLASALQLRGKPAGRYKEWLSFGGAAGALPAAPAITSSDATFEEWHPPMVAGTCRVNYVATGNDTALSVLVELAATPAFAVVLQSQSYNATANTPEKGYFTLTDADRDATYYFRITPYDAVMVSGVASGTAGLPATVNTHALPLRATVASVTTVSSDVATLTTTVGTLSTAVTGPQSANRVYAGPTSGGSATPSFRALVAADIPAIAESGVTGLVSDLALKAPLASPTFTGDPKAPTPSVGDNDTSIATTAFATAADAVVQAFAIQRANHTGTQTASTISDFNSASRAQTEAELVAGTNITITPSSSGATRVLTIASTGGGGGGSVALPGTIADLVLWFESDNILGASTVPVPVLNNRTPWFTGLNPIASGAAAQIASTTLNSLPVITFPGNSAGRYLYGAPMTGLFNGGATIFAVLNPNSLAAVGDLVSGTTGSLSFTIDTAGKLNFVKTFTAGIGTATTAMSVGTWYQVNGTYLPSSGAYAFRVARAAAGSGTSVQTVNVANSAIGYNQQGGNEDLNVKLAALIIYGRVLSGGEITSVESYINTKWGV